MADPSTEPAPNGSAAAAQYTEPSNPETAGNGSIKQSSSQVQDGGENQQVALLQAELKTLKEELVQKSQLLEKHETSSNNNGVQNGQLQKELDVAISELSLVKDQLQKRHDESSTDKATSITQEETDKLNAQIEQLTQQLSSQKKEHDEELAEVTKARDDYHAQYQSLLDRVGRIKTSLGDKLKRDAEDLGEAKIQVAQLEKDKKSLNDSIEDLKKELIASTKEADSLSRDLSLTRNDYQRGLTSWESERDALVKESRQVKQQLEMAQSLAQDLQSSIQDEKMLHTNYLTKIQDLEDQISQQMNYAERYRSEGEVSRARIKQMETEFDRFRNIKQNELDTLQQEVISLKEKQVELSTQRDNAQAQAKELAQAAESVPKLEAQVKEKQLLIGKLRHEAVTLNEHLTKALRVIKENSQGDTVDRQLVTNMLLSFVTLPRADTKRFEILQLIANYLSWDEDQKSQAGLVRPGVGGGTAMGLSNSNGGAASQNQPLSPRSSSFSRASPGLESGGTSGGGFMSMFADFLERESSRRA